MKKDVIREWGWAIEFPACPCLEPCPEPCREGEDAVLITQADYEPEDRDEIWALATVNAEYQGQLWGMKNALARFHFFCSDWCPRAKVTLWHRGEKFEMGALGQSEF